jgi:hypothetical protein
MKVIIFNKYKNLNKKNYVWVEKLKNKLRTIMKSLFA